jgi:hypothetical protein
MKSKRLDHINERKYTLVEEERFKSMERQILHMSYVLEDLSFQMRKFNETIKKLGEQLDEVKKNQQPIIINPSPVPPTNDPTQITQPYPYWWQYTPTITSATTATMNNNATKITGDAK